MSLFSRFLCLFTNTTVSSKENKKLKKAESKLKKKSSFTNKYIKKDEKSQNWIIESIIQYSSLPEYRNTYEDFIEANCLTFEDIEENRHEHFQIHKNYIVMVEKNLEKLISTLSIEPEILFGALQSSYRYVEYRPFIAEILNSDDFLLFKQMMVKKNKELEYETMMFMKENVQGVDKEEADLQYAIALSKKIQKQYCNEYEEEEELLRKAMKQSELSYKNEIQKVNHDIKKNADLKKIEDLKLKEKLEKVNLIKKNQDLKKQEDIKLKEEERKNKERDIRRKEAEERKKIIEEKLAKEKKDLELRMEKLKNLRKNLNSKKNTKFEISKNDVSMKKQDNNLEERKRRIIEQRDKLIKLKKEKRDKLLKNNFMEKKNVKGEKLDKKEILKRKQIYDSILGNK